MFVCAMCWGPPWLSGPIVGFISTIGWIYVFVKLSNFEDLPKKNAKHISHFGKVLESSKTCQPDLACRSLVWPAICFQLAASKPARASWVDMLKSYMAWIIYEFQLEYYTENLQACSKTGKFSLFRPGQLVIEKDMDWMEPNTPFQIGFLEPSQNNSPCFATSGQEP